MQSIKKLILSLVMVLGISSMLTNVKTVDAATKKTFKVTDYHSQNADLKVYYDFTSSKNSKKAYTTIKKVNNKLYNVTIGDGNGQFNLNFKSNYIKGTYVTDAKSDKYLKVELSHLPYHGEGCAQCGDITVKSVPNSLKNGKSITKTIKLGFVREGKKKTLANAEDIITIKVKIVDAPTFKETAMAYMKSKGYKKSMTELEKYLFLVCLIQDNVEYATNMNGGASKWAITETHLANCENVAKTFMRLGNLIGLDIRENYDFNVDVNHVSNVVKLNGKWYHADLTGSGEPTVADVLTGYNTKGTWTYGIKATCVIVEKNAYKIPSKYLLGQNTKYIDTDAVGYKRSKESRKRFADEILYGITRDYNYYVAYMKKYLPDEKIKPEPEPIVVDNNNEEIPEEDWISIPDDGYFEF